MASERIQNEYDSVRIANGLDTLAENLAGYTPESPVTPTNAMKAKLPSQSTGDRIADAIETLAQNVTDIGGSAITATYEEATALYPHVAGDHIWLNTDETVYLVTAAISVGDSIVYGTNITDSELTKNSIVGIKNKPGSGGEGGSGGHTIIDANGTELPQEDGLQFTDGLEAVDDSTNEKTIVRINSKSDFACRITNKDLIAALSGNWPCRDLTILYADEIANYSDEWQWIQARLNSGNIDGLLPGDYIPIKVGTENHLAEIAGINTYRRTGDPGHEVGYHIDWITRDCYSQTVQFNTTNNNNGNANSPNPFLASNLKSWLDGTLYPLLETKLKNVIKTKRIFAPSRYQSGATLTDDNSWAWQDFNKLWVPLETEIFGCLAWSTKGFGNGQAVQYPIFANSYEHRTKDAGPGGARALWWTASAALGASPYVVYVYAYGGSDGGNASNARCVPVCFRTMAD